MSNELDLTSNDAMHWAEQLEKHLKAGVAPDADYLVGWFANYWAAVHDPLKRKIEELEAALQPSLPQDVEPVAWHTEDHLTDRSATTYDRYCAERWKQKGWPVTPLYYCSEATPPGKVLVPVAELRPKIIDCLLATSGLSDGVAADAIVSILTASNGE